MKKVGIYNSDVEVNSATGEVLAAHCDCSVGSGITAHCKHVFALMLAVEHMSSQKKIILRNVCTQELQTFHHPSEIYFGTPVKSENLHCGRAQKKHAIFQPYSTSSVNAKSYRDRVRNLCISHAASNLCGKKFPLNTLFMPANPYAVVWDHAYAKLSWEQQLLLDLKLTSISKEEIQAIEMETRGQSANKKWFTVRCSHLTSSRYFAICSAKSEEAKKTLARLLVNVQTIFSSALLYGRENEDKALKKFEEKYGLKVERPGVIISKSHPYLAASLDAFVGDLYEDFTIFEVKCPITAKNMAINHITVPYLKLDENGNTVLDCNCDYYYQIQGQMLVTGGRKAKLIVYTITDLKVYDVPRDEEKIHQIMCTLEDFYENYFRPALFEKYIFKYYDTVFKKQTVTN
jgi:hypothetical protein